MNALAGIRVLVTRPAHQADGLCAAIEAEGGVAVRFPTIAIEPVDGTEARARLAGHDWDWIIFTSANAVGNALTISSAWRDRPLIAVGKATRDALRAAGLDVALTPSDGFNSEALLALPELADVVHRRILIVRGEGGRETLAGTLRDRGAKVAYADVYRRVPPAVDPAPLLARWRDGGIDVVTVTSNETLTNLAAMLGDQGRALLARTPVVAVSDRVLQIAARLGLSNPPRVAASAHDADVLAALVEWRRDSGTAHD